jgi:hypothetical protein
MEETFRRFLSSSTSTAIVGFINIKMTKSQTTTKGIIQLFPVALFFLFTLLAGPNSLQHLTTKKKLEKVVLEEGDEPAAKFGESLFFF